MSQVTIHHPSSYGHSGQTGLPATVTAGVSATFSWKNLDASGNPHAVVWGDATGNGALTIAADGTGTLAHTYASNGTYVQKVTDTGGRTVSQRTFTVPYAGGAGFAPAMVEQGAADDSNIPTTVNMATGLPQDLRVTGLAEDLPGPEVREEFATEPTNGAVPTDADFDPADYTVPAVLDFANENPDDVPMILTAERRGRNRSTLVSQLEAMMPFDPADHSVAEVVEWAEENDDIEALIAAEEAGKNRVTLLNTLRGML